MNQSFTIQLEVKIRACRRIDLLDLEWFGWQTAYRDDFASAVDRHEHGELVFLVAEANHFPVGKIWVDVSQPSAGSAAMLGGLTIMPCFQNLRVGTRLMKAAEECAKGHGFAIVRTGNGLDSRLGGNHRDLWRGSEAGIPGGQQKAAVLLKSVSKPTAKPPRMPRPPGFLRIFS